MSTLFDRLLEEQLRTAREPKKPTFAEKREEWLAQAHAKLTPGAPVPPTVLRVAIDMRQAQTLTLTEPTPRPTPPPPEPVNLKGPLVSLGSCKAVNPATGIACALLKGHTKNHRHGSTEFTFGAAPGETHFSRRAALDRHATTRHGSTTGES